jgi:hypothetical protein
MSSESTETSRGVAIELDGFPEESNATMKHRRAEQEQKLADDARLMRSWRKWHREQLEEALAGPHSSVLDELFRMCANLKHVQPAQLIGFVRSIDWSAIPYNIKLTVVHELNIAITAFRVKRGLPEIDDGLPGEPDTPFRTIRAIVLAPERQP